MIPEGNPNMHVHYLQWLKTQFFSHAPHNGFLHLMIEPPVAKKDD